MGINRPVFYSDVAAPRIERFFRDCVSMIEDDFEDAAKDKVVKAAITNKHIARRLERLRDIVSVDEEAA